MVEPVEAKQQDDAFCIDKNPYYRLGNDQQCVWRIARAWNKLSRQHRPKFPAALLSLLKDIYQYPYPDFISRDSDIGSRIECIDAAYDQLLAAARALIQQLPESDHWEVLPEIMGNRLPAGSDEDDYGNALAELPLWLSRIVQLPPLARRPGSNTRGRPRKWTNLRPWVVAICWYVVNKEEEPLTLGFDEVGVSNSRITRLVRTTLNAMGLQVEDIALQTELRHAKNLDLACIKYWDLIPVLPPRTPTPASPSRLLKKYSGSAAW